MISYDDKECSLWLSSKGSLKVDDQQFDHWIRVAQTNPSRKSIMDVKGFGKKDTQRNLGGSSLIGASVVHEGIVSLWLVSGSVAGSEINVATNSKKVMELSLEGVG